MFRIANALVFLTLLPASYAATQQTSSAPGAPVPGLPGFRVELGLNDAGRIESVLVYKAQQLIQTFNVCTGGAVTRTDSAGTLNTADYNFDGFPDLALQVDAGKENRHFCMWLFDPERQRFEASPQLSQLTNPVPEARSGTVVSTKYGPCPYCYNKQQFRWAGKQLELIREDSLTMDPLAVGAGGCNFILTIKERKNGQLREASRERATAFSHVCSDEFSPDDLGIWGFGR